MPGKVVALLAQPGQKVDKGAPLLILEAMKMEHTITAPAAGTIKKFSTPAGGVLLACRQTLAISSGARYLRGAARYLAAGAPADSSPLLRGVEVASHNVQVNAIAQNFVDNPTYFPADVQANPRFQERLKREVPLGRLVGADEDAEFAAYLCSDSANCFVGQVFPVCGGWVTR
jgi:pyruvate/2-oxoglutarate dehydrogenase complex dihydrolipoamide acyltransferase (E2) component